MEKSETRQSNAPSLESLLRENRSLILDCLEISNCIYLNLTGDGLCSANSNNEPNCMMLDASMQNEDLKSLVNLLSILKTTILN